MNQKTEIKTWLLDFGIIFLLFVISYGFYLGSYALFLPDEARYVEISREMLRSGDYLAPRIAGLLYFEKPVLFFWMESLALKIGGVNLWSARSINALFALLGCGLVYFMGRKYHERTAGLYAALILGSSLLYIVLARYITLDMTLTFWLSTCLLSFLRAYLLAPGFAKRIWCYIAYAAAALAVLSKGLIGIVLPVGIVGLWIVIRWDWKNVRYLYIPSGLLIFLLIALPWHIAMQLQYPDFFNFYIIDQHFSRYATMSAKRYEPVWFFIPIIVAGFLPWIVFLPDTIKSYCKNGWIALREDPVNSFLMVWIVVIFSFFSLSHSKLVPYVLPVFPPLALLVSHYFASLQNRKLPLKALYVLLGIVTFFALVSFTAPLWFMQALVKYKIIIPYLCFASAILFMTTLICCYCWRNKKLMRGIFALTLGFLFSVNFILISIEPVINQKTTQPIAQYLTPILTDQDIIIAYDEFYYDLPFYLDRLVLLSYYYGELMFGVQHELNNTHVISPEKTLALWESPQRIYIVMPAKTYPKFQQEHHPGWVLASAPRSILVTNQPPQ